MAVGSPRTTNRLRMPSACAASKSPCTRSKLRPRVGKCSVVSMPTSSSMRWHTAHGLMRIRARGLSVMSTTSAPACATRRAPANTLRRLTPRGGEISTAKTKRPWARRWASREGGASASAALPVASPLASPARA